MTSNPRLVRGTASGQRGGRPRPALVERWRSGLEEATAEYLRDRGVPFKYEVLKLKYERPAKVHTYTADFYIPHSSPDRPGIIVETKGLFDTADRQKHLMVRASNPDLDIRFVFSRSASPISKQSATTYAMWCEKHGFQYHDRVVPLAWLRELGYATT